MKKQMLIDCLKVKEVGDLLKLKSDEFILIKNRLFSLSTSMKEDWQGEEANTFFSKFDNYIEHLQSVPLYLNDKHILFTKSSQLHEKYDNDLKDQSNRRASNE